MSDQKFMIKLQLDTECSEEVTPQEVFKWVAEQFKGCDMGKVFVVDVTENKYSQGQLNAEDEGDLQMAMTVKQGKVILAFQKDVSWIGFDPDLAAELGRCLIERAEEAKRQS